MTTTPAHPATFDARAFGATGDGTTIDSPAINRAIDAASEAGGGTVVLPAGTYASYTVRLRSHVTLHLAPGATLLAAEPPPPGGTGGYDAPEPNEWGDRHQYQDFGHSHWRNSLVWGEGLHDIAITGTGLIHGRGLSRGPGTHAGLGNKAIALKLCRGVTLRDFAVRDGGHFALLATGVDNLTIDHVRVDTNRDGFDIDACRHVRISHCAVNTPNDDGIVLKSSFALGEARPTEHVTITGCTVTGYDPGTLLDGTFQRTLQRAPDRDGPTGRIKFGTESNGGFKNITIANCVFDRSRGLALETVDGGPIEDVTITNLTMRDVTTAPIFLRIGSRCRGPAGTPPGTLRRVHISHVVVSDADPRHPSIIAGLPEQPVEDMVLSDIRVVHRGGLSLDHVALQPAALTSDFFLRGGDDASTARGPREPFDVPERARAYPEPSMFGLLPAHALYVRHARGLTVRDAHVSFTTADTRPAVVLDDVADASFDGLRASTAGGAAVFALRDVRALDLHRCAGVADGNIEHVEALTFLPGK